MDIKNFIPNVPDWPKPGVNFLDVTKLLENPEAFNYCLYTLMEHADRFNASSIVAVESRGFIFGSVLAARLNLPLVLVRKPGKLPRATFKQSYNTEYSTDTLEINQDAAVGTRPYIVDDLLATGGTILATNQLLSNFNVDAVGAGVIVNLAFLPGAATLKENNIYLDSITVYG